MASAGLTTVVRAATAAATTVEETVEAPMDEGSPLRASNQPDGTPVQREAVSPAEVMSISDEETIADAPSVEVVSSDENSDDEPLFPGTSDEPGTSVLEFKTAGETQHELTPPRNTASGPCESPVTPVKEGSLAQAEGNTGSSPQQKRGWRSSQKTPVKTTMKELRVQLRRITPNTSPTSTTSEDRGRTAISPIVYGKCHL